MTRLLSGAQGGRGRLPPAAHAEPAGDHRLDGRGAPEALAAAERLDAVGAPADVVCVTSPGLLFKALLARQGREDAQAWILDQVFPAARATPLVTVLDGHPHTLAFLATVNQVQSITLGVTRSRPRD